jgi:serine/threonine-protein kinase
LTETWEATHVDLERGVAIKFLLQPQAGVAERMMEEARAIARIRHPHVAEFSDFGHTEPTAIGPGEPFFVMELLRGQTVEQLLARRRVIPWARAVAIVQQVGEALGAAHQQGVVHRDLRPGNVFLVDVGQASDFVKVVDFGLARGTTLGGTPSTMSPEQCRGEPLDPRSDVYAMGCLLYAMVTGDPPFVGAAQQVIWQQLNEAPKTLRERAPRQFIPDELEAIVTRCLAKHPGQRFADTRELAAALAQLAQFSAASSVVGGPLQDPSASGSRPMGYAGRPPPKSPRELTNSYKPVNQPIADDEPDEPAARPASVAANAPASVGMSVPAIHWIIGVTLAGLLAVGGVGVGMYWLVNRLIGNDGSAEVRVVPEAEHGAAVPSAKPPEPARAPASSEAHTPPLESAARGREAESAELEEQAPAQPEPAVLAPPEQEHAKPAKASNASRSEQPEPEPEPKPLAPEPEHKPSIEPDSKAKDKIGHDELLDPWG